ncbi:demethoxyubiquinone hydroxylase family protein [Sphingopyxis sp. GW247-27LB]|uniref:demethoxyubiquinone hydroxylase family protein n=1 Tax=Sphingopyxis sp. GW247-27LB TaxID=2012632 RepID=UPI000BA79657|nr:demethoxyubiquinone hydroxylase family protein [Sphingopyxis sp. GW247-27LB]PAL20493.1 demethoxyubiquinone hydroxylase family protein [Sphingopyxis sp. GW247-27LB]
MKVDHAGEHGAVCIYRAQRFFAPWRAPGLVAELDGFLAHEQDHRARFFAELGRRGRGRCSSYHLCGGGGFLLGVVTGLAGAKAVAATTVAIERVVLRHMLQQIEALKDSDAAATAILREIIVEEQQHHDESVERLGGSHWSRFIDPIVAASTEAVIWLGMRL